MPTFCKLKSSITPTLKRRTLKRGCWLAALGCSILGYGSTLSVETLSKFGALLFFTAILLIHIGMVPYAWLRKKELQYEQILLNEASLTLISNSHGIVNIPNQAIEKISFNDSKGYGIVVQLNQQAIDKLGASLELKKYQIYSKNRHGCDVYFPYFTERSYKKLQACLQDIVHT